MALVSRARKVIFCPSPGTASTSISEFLLRQEDFHWVPAKAFARDGFFVDYKHSGLTALLRFGLIDPAFARDAWSFSLVRNPFSWYVSEFLRHGQWMYLLADASSWVHRDPNTHQRIIAAQGDFLSFCKLCLAQNRPPDLGSDAPAWNLFHWTVDGCSSVFKYEQMSAAQSEICERLGLGPEDRFPYVNKTPVSTSLRDNLQLFSSGAAELIATAHAPTFERYGYSDDLAAAAQVEPDICVPNALPHDFSQATYLALNPDLVGAGIDPAQHYILYGQFELRPYK